MINLEAPPRPAKVRLSNQNVAQDRRPTLKKLGGIYHMLSKEVPYKELGADHFDKKSKDRSIRGCVRRLEQLGRKVDLEQQAA